MDKKLASFSPKVFKWWMNREYKEEKDMSQSTDLRKRKQNLKEITFMLYHVFGIIWRCWGKEIKKTTNQPIKRKKKIPKLKPKICLFRANRYGSLTVGIQALRGCGMHQWHYYEEKSTQHMAGVEL